MPEVVGRIGRRDLLIELDDEHLETVGNGRSKEIRLGTEALGDGLVAETEGCIEGSHRGGGIAIGGERGERSIEDGLVAQEWRSSPGRHAPSVAQRA